MLEMSEICVTVVCLQTNTQTTNKQQTPRALERSPGRETGFFFFVTMCQLQYSCSARGEGGAEPQ